MKNETAKNRDNDANLNTSSKPKQRDPTSRFLKTNHLLNNDITAGSLSPQKKIPNRGLVQYLDVRTDGQTDPFRPHTHGVSG